MTYQEFTDNLHLIHQMRVQAKAIEKSADKLEDDNFRQAGIFHVDREPGFAGWTFEGANRYYNTPQEAAKTKLG